MPNYPTLLQDLQALGSASSVSSLCEYCKCSAVLQVILTSMPMTKCAALHCAATIRVGRSYYAVVRCVTAVLCFLS